MDGVHTSIYQVYARVTDILEEDAWILFVEVEHPAGAACVEYWFVDFDSFHVVNLCKVHERFGVSDNLLCGTDHYLRHHFLRGLPIGLSTRGIRRFLRRIPDVYLFEVS